MSIDAPLWVHWVRHGKIESHRGDMPLTDEGVRAVARRLLTFAVSLLDLPREQPRRYMCVTHSTTMRAFLRRYLVGQDPGEPKYLESIDLRFAPDGILTLRFREQVRDVVWRPSLCM